MEISLWIINPFDRKEVQNVILQEELEHSTNEDLNVKFKCGYKIFRLRVEILEKYPGLWGIKQFVVTNCSSERPGSIVTETLKNGILIPIVTS